MYELIICNADGEVLRRFDLGRVEAARARVIIGRADDCDVQIRSASVSRHHCVIELDDVDRWIVRDMGSTHGVLVNGTPVAQTHLRDGLRVRIGPAVLAFRAAATAQIAREIADELNGPRS